MAEKEKTSLSPKHIDTRVIERYKKNGMVDEKEFARHLKALPDLTDACVKVETEFGDESDIGPTA